MTAGSKRSVSQSNLASPIKFLPDRVASDTFDYNGVKIFNGVKILQTGNNILLSSGYGV